MDRHSFYIGEAFDAYTYFGAHPTGGGVWFRVYAPNAREIKVIGEWNDWQGEAMQADGQSGFYTLFSPEAEPGQMYKYRIDKGSGWITEHCDPYGFGMELRPAHASIIRDLTEYVFDDEAWMQQRGKGYDRPVSIYELHFGSWLEDPEGENGWFRYHELADRLIAYLTENGYSHVEFLPLSEHPADCSWGYQNTGFFSPTSRYGTARDLMELIDRLHRAGIGVIMDFVPVHFALDHYALAEFDGTCLYEYPHRDVGESEWGTYNFMHSRGEVCSFLQSAANFWLQEFHVDGLRMDAISRAIYWQGDPKRGVNDNAVRFIRTMNRGLHGLHPTAMLIAEDSTSFPKVTASIEYGGLGFDYKWDLGWMNDTLEYFQSPPQMRGTLAHNIMFSIHYFPQELYLLPFSHDEVVHGKATIIQKMWGDYEQKFPQCRALFLYMFTHPGKKLNFMGNEFAQFREWDESREQDWMMLNYPLHQVFHCYMRELNLLYRNEPLLYEGEYNIRRFSWLPENDPDHAVFLYRRGDSEAAVIVALNLYDEPAEDVEIALESGCTVTELLNTDWKQFGGQSAAQNAALKAGNGGLTLTLAPFSGRILKVEAAVPAKKCPVSDKELLLAEKNRRESVPKEVSDGVGSKGDF